MLSGRGWRYTTKGVGIQIALFLHCLETVNRPESGSWFLGLAIDPGGWVHCPLRISWRLSSCNTEGGKKTTRGWLPKRVYHKVKHPYEVTQSKGREIKLQGEVYDVSIRMWLE